MKVYFPVRHIGHVPYKIRRFSNLNIIGPPIVKLRYLSSMKVVYVSVKSDKIKFDIKIPYKLVRTFLDDLYKHMSKYSSDATVEFNLSPYNKITANISYSNLKNFLKTLKKDYFVQPQYILDNKDVKIDEILQKF